MPSNLGEANAQKCSKMRVSESRGQTRLHYAEREHFI